MGSIGERNPLMDSMDDDELDIKQREGLPQYALRVSTRAKRMQLTPRLPGCLAKHPVNC